MNYPEFKIKVILEGTENIFPIKNFYPLDFIKNNKKITYEKFSFTEKYKGNNFIFIPECISFPLELYETLELWQKAFTIKHSFSYYKTFEDVVKEFYLNNFLTIGWNNNLQKNKVFKKLLNSLEELKFIFYEFVDRNMYVKRIENTILNYFNPDSCITYINIKLEEIKDLIKRNIFTKEEFKYYLDDWMNFKKEFSPKKIFSEIQKGFDDVDYVFRKFFKLISNVIISKSKNKVFEISNNILDYSNYIPCENCDNRVYKKIEDIEK